MNENNANFTPDAPNFKTLVRMSFQGLTNFPYIEEDFDALTNYGLLSKVIEYLNEVISNNNEQNELMTNLYNAYVSLQDYVNNYFGNLDVQDEINNKLDEMAEDGTLTTLIGNYIQPLINEQNNRINALESEVRSVASGSPLVASSVSGMTDTRRIYVNTTDGHWYYYNGTSWIDGGVYQATGLSENSQIYKKVNNLNNYTCDIFRKENSIFGYYGINGVFTESTTYKTTDYLEVPKYANNVFHYINETSPVSMTLWDEGKNFIKGNNMGANVNYTLPSNAKYIRVTYLENTNVQLIFEYIEDIEKILTKYNDLINYNLELFSTKNASLGYFTPTGVWTSDTITYGTTDYIEIPENSTKVKYETDFTNLTTYTFWDSNKNFVRGGNHNNGLTEVFIPNNAKYIRVGFMQSNQKCKLYFNYLEKLMIPHNDEHLTNIFERVGVIGDSLSVGWTWNKETQTANYRLLEYSWPQFLGRKLNRTWRNYGFSGAKAETWFSNSYGESLLLSEDSCQAYVICMGVNDGSTTVGTSSDINLENKELNGDTFYGWYGKIIQTIKEKNSKAKIFVATLPFPYTPNNLNAPIRDMANIFDDVYVIDLANDYDNYFQSGVIRNDRLEGHNTPIGYSALANVYDIAITNIIKNNIEDFQDIPFI